MLNVSIAIANVFNPKQQGKLAPLCDQLLSAPGHKLSSMIKDGKLTSAKLCELFAERIRQVQPHINCMCQERFSEALAEARRIDALLEEVRSGSKQVSECSAEEREMLDSPLLGVPISIKESIQVKGMRNSCGIWARRETVADEDAVAVKNVRRFGMIPICTTNVPECTLFWADCQNLVYGRTLNPYDLSRISGASSGGEGSLIGSGASVIGIGSDIGGSLRIPAHYCGIFSHKPSPFLICWEGNYPEVKPARGRMFTLGPMCRYASDLKPLFKCLMSDKNNPKQDIHFKYQPKDIGALRSDLIARLDEPVDISALKILYFDFNQASKLTGKQSIKINEEIMTGQQEVLNHFKTKFNCTLEHFNLDKYMKKIMITWQCMIRCANKEARDDYEDHELEKLFGIKSLGLEFVKMPLGLSKHTKEALLAMIVVSAVPEEREKAFALCDKFEAHGQELRDEIHKALGNNGVLIMPTLPTVAYKHNVSLTKTPDCRFPALFNVLELPVTHATMRLDKQHQLPFGYSIAAAPYQDHLTLAMAEEIEAAFGGWVPPPSGHQPTDKMKKEPNATS